MIGLKFIKPATVLMLLALLAACGRAGPLEPPPASATNIEHTKEEKKNDKPFVLDALLN